MNHPANASNTTARSAAAARIARAGMLALIGIPMCGTALAQSSIKISGAVDTGIAYFKTDTTSLWKMASGSIAASSLSFSGNEDLGNGYSAFFVMRDLFVSSTGEISGTKLFGSEAKVGIKGAHGTVELGRLFNPTHQLLIFRSPSISNFAGAFNMGIGGAGYAPYWDNSVRYTTPKMNGFTALAQHSLSILNAEGLPPNKKDKVGSALGLQYAKGPLDLIGTIEQTRTQLVPQTDYTARRGSIAGIYDFKVAKLHAIYHQQSYSGTGKPVDFNIKIIGTTIPFSPTLKGTAEYGHKKYESSPDAASFLGLGLFYNLSRRTILYAQVVVLENDGANRQSIYRGPALRPGEDISGYTVGLRHSF